MENFTIALSNGKQLKDLELNGSNFITREEVTPETFEDGLSPVVINGEEHEQMALVQIARHEDGRYWFILRDVTPEEIAQAKLRSDIEYIAMMADIELEG